MKAMRVMSLLLASVLMLTPACLPPVTCTPGGSGCGDDGDTPTVCSSTGRAWAVSSPRVRCAEVGGVCAVRDGVAACVRRPVDAGADINGDAAVNGGD